MTTSNRQTSSGTAGPRTAEQTKGYLVAHFDEIEPVACPCGSSRRAFSVPENDAATFHVVDISVDSRLHYHKKLTEIYYVLEGKGHLELDQDRLELQPGMAVLIRPETRHRAVGKLRVIVVSVPRFDPNDEWFD